MIILRQKEFGLFDGIRKLNDRYCKWKNPNYKTEKEREEERRLARVKEAQNKQKEIEDKFASISRQHKILLDIDKKTKKFFPSWGDGDEYPSLTLNMNYNIGNISLGMNESWEEYKWNGKNWEEVNTPFHKIIPNIKSELIRRLEYYKKEYQANPYGFDKDELNEVLLYIDIQIKEIKKSSL